MAGWRERVARRDAERAEGDEAPSRAPLFAMVALAVVLLFIVGFVLGGGGYTVRAQFQNAGQLVKGAQVLIGGTRAGQVKGFEVTPDGQVQVEMEIDEGYAPLRRGARAVIRQSSQSSVANRYVELHLASEDGSGDEIDDGGLIPADKTTTAVDIDQLFNLLNRETRKNLRGFFRANNRLYAGRGEEANRGLLYLAPSLNSSASLFRELSADPPVLERFIVESSKFVTALADRREDLAALIGNLNDTTRALGSEKEALAEAIERFPGFMRTANSTYVNLRATLDDLDPFVAASKPVARKLRPYLAELRPFARDARPTVRDLALLARRPGRDNDLLELNRTYPGLANITVDTDERKVDFGTGNVDVGRRRGAFPELSEALTDTAPIVAHGRPYTVDLLGWFDDFSHTGAYDALGSFSRGQSFFNAFTLSDSTPIPLDQRGQVFKQLAKTNQLKRCPGASEEAAVDGSNVFTPEEQKQLDCVEAHRATGPSR